MYLCKRKGKLVHTGYHRLEIEEARSPGKVISTTVPLSVFLFCEIGIVESNNSTTFPQQIVQKKASCLF